MVMVMKVMIGDGVGDDGDGVHAVVVAAAVVVEGGDDGGGHGGMGLRPAR